MRGLQGKIIYQLFTSQSYQLWLMNLILYLSCGYFFSNLTVSLLSKNIIIPPTLLLASYSQKHISWLINQIPPAKCQIFDSELPTRVNWPWSDARSRRSPSTMTASSGAMQVVLSERMQGISSGISAVGKDIRWYDFIISSNKSSCMPSWLMPWTMLSQT